MTEKQDFLFEVSKDGILLLDPDGRIVSANKAAALLFGYDRQELTGMATTTLLDDLILVRLAEPSGSQILSTDTIKTNEPFLSRGVRKDGHVFSVFVIAGPARHYDSPAKSILVLQANGEDPTCRTWEYIGQEKIRKAIKEISRLIHKVVIDQNFTVRYENPIALQCCDFMECGQEECPCYEQKGVRCWQVAGTYCAGKVQGKFAQKRKECMDCNFYKAVTPDPICMIGEEFNNMMHILESKNKELENAYREMQRTHSRMLQREKLASIGQLAAGVAHEINNPMGFISSNLQTLRKYIDRLLEFVDARAALAFPEKAESDFLKLRRELKIDYIIKDLADLIEESLEGADRVKKIVQNLKNFSRVDKVDMSMEDLNNCLETTLNILWNELKYKAIIHRTYGELPKIMCYPQELNQVFMNLLMNSIQAIENKGIIRVRSWQMDDKVYVTVEDDGCGIPGENLNRIFEPFFTTKEVGKGIGLGLSICYDIIKKHHGDITVGSVVGKGTKVTVELPVTP